MKSITIADILTDAEIVVAQRLYQRYKDSGEFASKVAHELIEPNIDRINRNLGQENDIHYLAYAVEYVFSHSSA
jgi:hypothetical protein